MLKIIKYYRS